MRTLQPDGEGGRLGAVYSIYSVRICSITPDKIAPIDAGRQSIEMTDGSLTTPISNETSFLMKHSF